MKIKVPFTIVGAVILANSLLSIPGSSGWVFACHAFNIMLWPTYFYVMMEEDL